MNKYNKNYKDYICNALQKWVINYTKLSEKNKFLKEKYFFLIVAKPFIKCYIIHS